MRHKKVVFPGSGGDLPGEIWLPDAAPLCLVQLLPENPAAERSGAPLAEFLTAQGAGLAIFRQRPAGGWTKRQRAADLSDAGCFARQLRSYLPAAPLLLWAQGAGTELAYGLLGGDTATYCCAVLCGAALPGWGQALASLLRPVPGPSWPKGDWAGRAWTRRRVLGRELAGVDRSLPLLLAACTGRDRGEDISGCRRVLRALRRKPAAAAAELYLFHGLGSFRLEQGPDEVWRPLWQWSRGCI